MDVGSTCCVGDWGWRGCSEECVCGGPAGGWDKGPQFTLPTQEGNPVSLKDFHGKWVVLYFYPKDMTTGCTIEAHNFQRDQEQYVKRNAVVLGVNVNSWIRTNSSARKKD